MKREVRPLFRPDKKNKALKPARELRVNGVGKMTQVTGEKNRRRLNVKESYGTVVILFNTSYVVQFRFVCSEKNSGTVC